MRLSDILKNYKTVEAAVNAAEDEINRLSAIVTTNFTEIASLRDAIKRQNAEITSAQKSGRNYIATIREQQKQLDSNFLDLADKEIFRQKQELWKQDIAFQAAGDTIAQLKNQLDDEGRKLTSLLAVIERQNTDIDDNDDIIATLQKRIAKLEVDR